VRNPIGPAKIEECDRFSPEESLMKIAGVAFLTTLLMSGQAQAQAQIIWSEKVTELVLEYGDVIGKTVTEYAVKEYLDWLFKKKPATADQTPPSANAKAVEDIVNRMSEDQQYLDKHPQAKQIASLLVASDICLGDRAGGDEKRTIDACSIVIDSESVSRWTANKLTSTDVVPT
jgi:hypothetical protein